MMQAKTIVLCCLGLFILNLHAAEARSSRRRRQSNVYVIANTTFECPTTETLHVPTEDELTAIFKALGGSFNPSYMARNVREAQNFPNLLPVITQLYSGETTKSGILSQLKASVQGPLQVPDRRTAIATHSNVANGTTSTIDYCLTRGTPTATGTHLYLCTTCSATTTYPAEVWPPIINEALCTASDNNCFIVEGVAQGVCQTNELPLNFMCKAADQCTLLLLDGSSVVVEAWELCTIPIRVGCECTIDTDSYFAKFV